MRYFRVKYGFGVLDQVSIDDTEIEKAIYAQLTGKAVQLGTDFINGKNIVSITPHYHRHTGWYDTYEPKDAEDLKQIARDCPPYEGVMEAYKNRVATLLQAGKENMIGKLPPLEFDGPQRELLEATKELAQKLKIAS